MPRGRPKGSKNKSTLLKEENTTTTTTTDTVVENFAEPENEPEVETEEGTSMDGVIENPPEAEKKNTSPKVKKNNMPMCSRCGKEIKTTPYRLNLTYLSGGVASWHRYTADDKPILCKECASELSGIIDKWLIEGGAETKFPVPNMVGVDVSEAEDMTVVNNKFVNKKIEGKENKEENKEEDFDF